MRISRVRPRAFTAGVALIACALNSAPAAAQTSPWTVRSGSAFTLAGNAALLQNEYFRVEQWGIASMKTSLWHGEWLYPTAADRNLAGVFFLDAHKFAVGDFDGDGDKDVFLNLVSFPHTLLRPKIAPILLRNTGGRLQYWPEGWNGAPPERYFSYKAIAADFNRDGRDDVVTAAGGVLTRNNDGTFSNTWDPIATMMSGADGRLADASTRIEGQASGGVMPDFQFAHDLAVGDINGDGLLDMYQGRHLLLGDGRGGFTRRNDLLPAEARNPQVPPAMSSAIGDLDGDGVGDLVVAYMDGNGQASGWIFLSDGRGGIAQGRQVALPAGRYGAGTTKHNEMRIADLDGDGRADIVIGQTRANPYYRGRTLQVLMNKGGGNFVDESDARIRGDDRDAVQGEGPVILMDINGDGHVDIVDSASGAAGLGVFVNDGRGTFTRMPRSLLPIVRPKNFAGWENLAGTTFGESEDGTEHIYPVILDGNGVSYLVQHIHSPPRWPPQEGDSREWTFYVIRALKPYAPATATRGLAAADNATGLWWNAAESGWGINLNHQGSTMFGALFSYAADGAGMWLVMPDGRLQSDGTFQGSIYQTTGPAFNANPFPPLGGSVGSVTSVGTMQLSFNGPSAATLQYSVNGASVTKQIVPQVFAGLQVCSNVSAVAGSRAARTNYTDLWWVPSESGWGINVTHQADTVFATLFNYAAGPGNGNRGMWLVMSGGVRQADGSYRGDLYQLRGPVFNSSPFPPVGASNLTRVGAMQLRFGDGERGTLVYDINGTTVTKSIVPQTFGSQWPSCRRGT